MDVEIYDVNKYENNITLTDKGYNKINTLVLDKQNLIYLQMVYLLIDETFMKLKIYSIINIHKCMYKHIIFYRLCIGLYN